MKMNLLSLQLLILISCGGCINEKNGRQDIPATVMEVINSTTRNRKELLAVIEHYRKDPLKLKAAFYLIQNLKQQFHYEGPGVLEQKKIYEVTDSIWRSGDIVTNRSWDSIRKSFKIQNRAPIFRVRDIDVITARFLIRNIDGAFISWSYPWAKDMGFNEFCEYILPYKIMDESFDDWRAECQKKYAWVLTSLIDCHDPRVVCSRINDSLKTKFDLGAASLSGWDVTYSDLNKTRTGVCANASQYTCYIMRAMGLPVVIDFCPYWANKNSGHEWNCLVYRRQSLPFAGCESNPGQTKIQFTKDKWIRRKSAKIFRHSFTKEINYFKFPDSLQSIYSALSLTDKLSDVTDQYVPTGNILIKLNKTDFKPKYGYLCVFNDLGWRPVFFSDLYPFNFSFFKAMAKDIVYLPIYMVDNQQIPAAPPFIYTKNGDKAFFEPDLVHRSSIVLRSKYPEDRYESDKANNIIIGQHYELFYWDNGWMSLGRQLAERNILIYKNVPQNALLWLRNLDKGRQERIFAYKNDQQIWW